TCYFLCASVSLRLVIFVLFVVKTIFVPRAASESDAEPELHRPVLSCDRLLVLQRGALLRAERVVIHVEQVECLGNQVHLHTVGQREPLLEPHVRPILHRLNKAVARDDRAVRTQPTFTTGPGAAPVPSALGGG